MPARLLGRSGVHPANMPVILPSKLLRRASDEDLAAHYDRVQGGSRKDGRARAQVLHDMERRDALPEGKKAREHAKFSRQLAQADAVEASCVHAEAATRGNMVNAKGRAWEISPRTLITGRLMRTSYTAPVAGTEDAADDITDEDAGVAAAWLAGSTGVWLAGSTGVWSAGSTAAWTTGVWSAGSTAAWTAGVWSTAAWTAGVWSAGSTAAWTARRKTETSS